MSDAELSRKKLHKVRCTVILQLFRVESCSFHQNVQRLTGNTKNGQILNIVIKYSLFGSINTGDIFKAVMTEEKSAKIERYKINGKHIHPQNY